MNSNYTYSASKKIYFFFKRLGDIFGSLFGIIIFSPAMLLISLIIKCSSRGPILFKQERVGKNKKIFKMFKFRSMRADAPEIPPSEMTPEMQAKLQYKFGTFLRKTSLDEIPQLINIFIGNMSFIGPRPGAAHNEEELIEFREKYTPNAYNVRPGLGGYAQMMMHRDHEPERKAYYDHVYAEKINLWLDIKIFFTTIFEIFSKEKGR